MKGRPRIPTAIKKEKGTFEKYYSMENEFTPDAIIDVEPPEFLTDNQKKIFKSAARRFVQQGIFSVMDVDMVVAYAIEYDRYIEATKELNKSKGVVTINGKKQVNLYLKISNEALKNINKIGIEFGMTPSARTRIAVSPKDPKNRTIESVLDDGLNSEFDDD